MLLNCCVDEAVRIFQENWIIASLAIATILAYNYYTSTFDHFREKGIAFSKPRLFAGSLLPRLLLKKSFHDFNIDLYKQFDGLPYGGFFEGRRPILMIRDPELIKLVLIKEFDHFCDRNTLVQGRKHYSTRMLILLKGQEWKSVRSILTPTFSSSKLRGMMSIMNNCAEQMVDILHKRNDGDTELEMKTFMGRYTLDIIGSCAFGIECDSLKDSSSEFIKVAETFNETPVLKRIFIFTVLVFVPALFKVLPISLLNKKCTDRLVEMLGESKRMRDFSENKRNDFLQLILEAAKLEENREVLDETTLDAQIVLFIIAGFETSSTLLSFAAFSLAQNPEIQTKLRNEILSVVNKSGGINYENLNELPYLDMVLSETLRLYNPVPRIDRTCTKPYQFPNSELKFRVGDVVGVSVSGLHMDPLYYPNPTEFNPERFTAEEKANRPPGVYLPFGAGPRNCIGLRFALLSVKMAMARLILNFDLTPNAKTPPEITYDKKGFLLKAKDGLWINVEPRKK